MSTDKTGRSGVDILIDCVREVMRWKERWERSIEKKLANLETKVFPVKHTKKQRRSSTIDAYLRQGKGGTFPASVTTLAPAIKQRRLPLTSLIIMIVPSYYTKVFLSDLTSSYDLWMSQLSLNECSGEEASSQGKFLMLELSTAKIRLEQSQGLTMVGPALPEQGNAIAQPEKQDNVGDYYVMSIKSDEEFDAFIDAWRLQEVFAWEPFYKPPKEAQTPAQKTMSVDEMEWLRETSLDIVGLAVVWDPSVVYFVTLKGLRKSRLSQRWQKLKEVFESPGPTKVCFRGKSHLRSLLSHNVRIQGGIWDVQVAAWVFDSDRNKFNELDVLYQNWTKDKRTSIISSPHARVFCNAQRSLLIHQKMKEQMLAKPRETEVFDLIEMPLLPILAEMEYIGVGFKSDIFRYHKELIEAKIASLEQRAFLLAGKEFSLSSTNEVAAVLFENLKLPYPTIFAKKHSTGRLKYSTRAEVLQHVSHPLAAIVIEHRKLSHTIATYIEALPRFATWSERFSMLRIHSTCLQTAVPTGRLAFVDPNLQSIAHSFDFIPVKERDINTAQRLSQEVGCQLTPNKAITVNIRDAFVAREGYVLASFDYAQIELRLIAHFAKDEKLIAFLRETNKDVFVHIAAEWLRKHPSSISQKERNHTKQLCYGLLYGMGAPALALELSVSEDEARSLIASFKQHFPALTTYIQWAIETCETQGFVETLYGRRRYLPNIYSPDNRLRCQAERQAVNTICQGSAADIVKKAMLAVTSTLQHSLHSDIEIHDELLLEVPSSANEIMNAMESVSSLSLPLPVKASAGRTWGTLAPLVIERR